MGGQAYLIGSAASVFVGGNVRMGKQLGMGAGVGALALVDGFEAERDHDT